MSNLENLISSNQLPLFDAFDSNGDLTGETCMLCIHHDKKCKHQFSYAEGAFLICTKYPECLRVGCEME